MNDVHRHPPRPAASADLSHIKAAALVFVLILCPTPDSTGPARAMKEQSESASSSVVVIVVDDDLAVRSSLKFSLEIEGLTVHSFATGAELLNAIDLALCDCLVIDQKMPAMSGLELIAKLRDRHISAPAILITSHPSPALRGQAEKADIPIVEKPLLGNALLDKIRDVVGLRHE